jgi:AcrR family transcriptional regulator
VGRQQTWDTDEVLTSVMRIFLHQGYWHTSVRDVEAATNLHPGSLYKKYGSKERLFQAAVDHYNQRVVETRVRTFLLTSDDPIAGIRAYFTSSFDTGNERDPGCLLTNTAIEAFSLTPDCRERVVAGLRHLEDGFAQALRRAASRGQIPAGFDIADVAAHLLAIYQGLLVMVRIGTPSAKLHGIIDTAIDTITGRLAISRL